MDFTSLGVPEHLTTALAKRGIAAPTEIQAALIPAAYAGENLIGEAPTGTGKTLAYLLPLLARIDPAVRTAQALILAPTHELAMQIAAVARELIQAAGLSVGVQALIGGANIKRQIEALKKKPALIVGSAPRVQELHRLGKLKLMGVKVLVLDEFDRLLGKQHLDDVRALIRLLPPERQALLLSATAGTAAVRMAEELFAPRLIRVESVNETYENYYDIVSFRDKIKAVQKLTRRLPIRRGLVFVGRSFDAEHALEKLRYEGIKAVALLGQERRDQRRAALDAIRAGRAEILISTDLAARGLDIEDVDYVIHFDLPEDVRTYRHRAGRTARAGKAGAVISLVDAKEVDKLKALAARMEIDLSRLPHS
ncbi:DEAD/DEAH box helicase [Selenomonas sp. oral taxon 892]|uniref:DEAD/DEAH box helicase n=1 Tax=Selenomonas sp. oral taxon 892 TaxID=1321785 RepID=UPI00041BE93F|nr:DEAD/DEAH box helicase [Selenomonas sp. oral taxon 892]